LTSSSGRCATIPDREEIAAEGCEGDGADIDADTLTWRSHPPIIVGASTAAAS
jgi:hypothetical protein